MAGKRKTVNIAGKDYELGPDSGDEPEDGPEPDEPDDDGPAEDEPDDEPEKDEPAAARSGAGNSSPGPRRSGHWATDPVGVHDGAGLILGLLVWGWVVLPYLQDGKKGVKNALTAKFFNKKDGKPLP